MSVMTANVKSLFSVKNSKERYSEKTKSQELYKSLNILVAIYIYRDVTTSCAKVIPASM